MRLLNHFLPLSLNQRKEEQIMSHFNLWLALIELFTTLTR